jgi:hypothetical protein
MEENLWAKESLVTDIHGELLLSDGVHARILLDILGRLRVVPVELLGNVRTHVTVSEIISLVLNALFPKFTKWRITVLDYLLYNTVQILPKLRNSKPVNYGTGKQQSIIQIVQ